jgi:glutaredoxin 3
VKEFLSDHSVAFTERNVAEDLEARETLLATTGQQATPVIIVDGEIIEGFDRSRLQRVLHLTP